MGYCTLIINLPKSQILSVRELICLIFFVDTETKRKFAECQASQAANILVLLDVSSRMERGGHHIIKVFLTSKNHLVLINFHLKYFFSLGITVLSAQRPSVGLCFYQNDTRCHKQYQTEA